MSIANRVTVHTIAGHQEMFIGDAAEFVINEIAGLRDKDIREMLAGRVGRNFTNVVGKFQKLNPTSPWLTYLGQVYDSAMKIDDGYRRRLNAVEKVWP